MDTLGRFFLGLEITDRDPGEMGDFSLVLGFGDCWGFFQRTGTGVRVAGRG